MNWSNYEDVLGQMRSVGLVVEHLEVGRLRRCKVDGDRERRGWYNLHELTLDSGDVVLVGSFGVWRGTENNAQKVELRKQTLTSDQRAALKARIAADLRAAEKRRQAEAARAALRAQKVWEMCAKEGDAAYLHRKGVQGHGVRYSPKGAVVIPMLDTTGRIHGLQFIHAQKRNGRDKDFWPAGLAKTGHYFHIGPQPTTIMLVGEGYATCASAYEASGWPVAVAFDAGNLLPVAQALAKRYKGVKIIVLADDDYLTEGNPGISKAQAAAMATLGKMRFRVDGDVRARQPVLAQLMISHPNNSGLVMDQLTRHFTPAHFVRRIDVSYAGKPILTAEVDFSISENPNFRFYFVPEGEGELRAEVVDTDDLRFDTAVRLQPGS